MHDVKINIFVMHMYSYIVVFENYPLTCPHMPPSFSNHIALGSALPGKFQYHSVYARASLTLS